MLPELVVLAQLEAAAKRLAMWAWINVGIAALGGILTLASYNATAPGDRYIVFKGAIGWGLIFAVVNAVRYVRVRSRAAQLARLIKQAPS